MKFEYPSDRYSHVEVSTERSENPIFRAYDLIRRDVDDGDAITVCDASLSRCADASGGNGPYWIDAETHKLFLFNVTTIFRKINSSDGDTYEAFPACAVVDEDGQFSPAGGECYLLVQSNKRRTISILYQLGGREGDKKNNDREKKIRLAKDILDSLVLKKHPVGE